MGCRKKAWALFGLWAWLAGAGCALGESKVYTFAPQAVPKELTETALQVCAGDVTLTLTFAGDCTLGGTAGTLSAARGFGGVVEKSGLAYPFAKLQSLFATDDFTVVNLEGVLSDQKRDKAPGRRFCFIGKSSYAGILSQGSVEAVNLANNHTLDYGREGYQDTVQALEQEHIAYFGEDAVTVLEKDGVRIGFTGSQFGVDPQALGLQMEALRRAGCQWVVHSLHAGEEYAQAPTRRQRDAAAQAVESGAKLVVGHHPHVVQGMELLQGVPVLYSLGNGSFGGNGLPKTLDAALLRVELSFSEGELQQMQLTIWPLRSSGERRRNNYQPVLVEGEDALRVMDKLQNASFIGLAPYVEGQGARQPVIRYTNQE